MSNWSLSVKVVPGASRTQVVGAYGEGIRVRIAAPPEKGRANEELLSHLAEVLDCPVSRLRISSGSSSPRKVVELSGVDQTEARTRLGL